MLVWLSRCQLLSMGTPSNGYYLLTVRLIYIKIVAYRVYLISLESWHILHPITPNVDYCLLRHPQLGIYLFYSSHPFKIQTDCLLCIKIAAYQVYPIYHCCHGIYCTQRRWVQVNYRIGILILMFCLQSAVITYALGKLLLFFFVTKVIYFHNSGATELVL